MAFQEFQSFQTKPSRGAGGVIALLMVAGLGIGVAAYWYAQPAGLKPAATAEITPDAASTGVGDAAPTTPKSGKTTATPAAVQTTATTQTATTHSGKGARSQTPAVEKTSSEKAPPSPSAGTQPAEGQAVPAYAPTGATVQLAQAPADPTRYDKTHAEVTAPVLLTPLSHVPLPPEIRREASSTDVAIQVMVNEEGTVDIVKATVSPRTLGESILVYNGLSIAKTWRFRPASKNGLPVKYRLLVPLSMF